MEHLAEPQLPATSEGPGPGVSQNPPAGERHTPTARGLGLLLARPTSNASNESRRRGHVRIYPGSIR